MERDPLIHYDLIWARLKRDGKVSITANRAFHRRIIKAVTKQKWKDIGFKIQIEPKYAFLSYSRSYAILTFHLDIRYAIDYRTRGPLTLEDV